MVRSSYSRVSGRVSESRISGSARGRRQTRSQTVALSPARWASGLPGPGHRPGVSQVQVGEARRGRTAAWTRPQALRVLSRTRRGWALARFWAYGRAPAPLPQARRERPRKCRRSRRTLRAGLGGRTIPWESDSQLPAGDFPAQVRAASAPGPSGLRSPYRPALPYGGHSVGPGERTG